MTHIFKIRADWLGLVRAPEGYINEDRSPENHRNQATCPSLREDQKYQPGSQQNKQQHYKVTMASFTISLACQVLLWVFLVQGSPLDSADSVRPKRSAAKWWSPMASCLGVPRPLKVSANNTLTFVRRNTLVVPLINPSPASSVGALPHSGPCQFTRTLSAPDYSREPNRLSQAECSGGCNPKLCTAVKYNVPVLKKKICSDANVWVRATEQVTVAFIEK